MALGAAIQRADISLDRLEPVYMYIYLNTSLINIKRSRNFSWDRNVEMTERSSRKMSTLDKSDYASTYLDQLLQNLS